MHSYSVHSNHSAYIHVALAAAAVGLYWLITFLPLPPFAAVGPVTAFSLFAILEFVFDRWGWRVLGRIPGLGVDDFSGTYVGTLCAGDGTEHKATYKIKQTWSRIEIDFESEGATSKSFSAAVIKDRLQNGQVELVYNYYVHGRRTGPAVLAAHYGTAMLKLVRGGQRLEGDYFTEQDRNSFGSVQMVRTQAQAA